MCLPGPKIDHDHFFSVELSPSARFAYELQGDFLPTRGVVTSLTDGAHPPRTPHGHHDLWNAHVGPDDAGRVGWEAGRGTVRNEGPHGMQDTPSRGQPLGFDLKGNVLEFVQPPLVKTHVTGHVMPPAQGTLDDHKCKLLARAPSR